MSNAMFYTGLSGLTVAQESLVTTGHNTANVNTPGYRRQTTNISSSGGTLQPSVGFFGAGAHSTSVTRSYDAFLAKQLYQAQASNESLSTYLSQISQVDDMLANPTAGLAPLIQNFFGTVQGMANLPADPAARQQMINAGQTMTNQFRSMSKQLIDLNTGVNQQIEGNIEQINVYADRIGSLNKQISLLTGFGDGQKPNDLLDQRDQLVNSLGKLIGTKVVVQDGGQYNVFIGNGQTLVLGNIAYQLQAVSSAVDPSRIAVAVTGASGTSTELKDSALTGGALGGLLQFRRDTLMVAENSVGRLAIVLADTFNAQHHLGVDLNGTLGTDFFSQASPATLANGRNKGNLVLDAVFANPGQLSVSDYTVEVTAGGNFNLTRLSDKTLLGTYTAAQMAAGITFDGLTLQSGAGAALPGDSYVIQPTRAGARDIDVLVLDPADVAAAAPIVTGNTAGNKGSGVINAGSVDINYLATPLAGTKTLTYAAGPNTLTIAPATAGTVTVTLPNGSPAPGSPFASGAAVTYTPGATINFDGITLTLSGTPANGDTFTVKPNVGGVSDGRNALMLTALQQQKTLNGNATYNDAFAQLVSTVGNRTRQVDIAHAAQTSLVAQIRFADQSATGVNQDEETANLLMFQQMYQANAKVIQTASTIFDAVLGIH
jgi:flagellar hook-associated protein 1